MLTFPCLLPMPRKYQLTEGLFTLFDKNVIVLQHKRPQALLFSALRLQEGLKTYSQLNYEIYAGHATNLEHVGITLRVNGKTELPSQGYRLIITPDMVTLEAGTEMGIFYACCSLIQILQSYSASYNQAQDVPVGCLPCLEIEDWPDFPYRAVMLDISRDKVPSMDTTLDLVDLLASWKINQFQLYTEHTFAYQRHPQVWAEASPFSGEEILKLDEYCRERFIELVPNQNSFGHLEHWLSLPGYKHLAEAPQGFDFPWGHHEGPFSLCPLDPGSLALIKDLYDELLPHFASHQFNVGCDETFDIGQGRSRAECERWGSGRIYLDFLLIIYKEVKKRGFRMQFWGDIIMAHPELVAELPRDSIALEWGYEADHPFDEHGARFAQAGLSFYVCPGTSSWNSIAGRTENCLANISNAAQNGLKHGAVGLLVTDWGDNGHWQVLPISYLGFAASAASAWCVESNQKLDIQQALNQYAFQDPAGGYGRLAYDVGNIYRQVGIEPPNASALFHILQHPVEEWIDKLEKDTAIDSLHRTIIAIDQGHENLSACTSMRKDQELLHREFALTGALLRHACMRGLYLYNSGEYSKEYLANDLEKIIEEYQLVWNSRNRPGGLRDSLAHFIRAKNEYQ